MNEENVLKLEKNSGIAAAEELGHKLEKGFQEARTTKIDASEVERVDTTTMQLIYSFMRSMEEQGVSVTVSDPSEDFLSGSARLGFTGLLKL